MTTIQVDVSEELLELLKHSRLGDRSLAEQVHIALAIQLFQEGIISASKAASIAGEPQSNFELLLGEMGIPALKYDLEDYRQDMDAFERARRK